VQTWIRELKEVLKGIASASPEMAGEAAYKRLLATGGLKAPSPRKALQPVQLTARRSSEAFANVLFPRSRQWSV
jgi:hypothetical protein